MNLIKHFIFYTILFIACSGFAAEAPVSSTFVAEHNSIQPGNSFWVAITLKIDKGWHLYWKNPGDSGLPISMEWTFPDGVVLKSVQWSTPVRLDLDGLIGFCYENEAVLLAELSLNEGFNRDLIEIKSMISWLACSDSSCQPGSQEVHLSLPLSELTPENNSIATPVFAEARKKIPQASTMALSYHHDHSVHIHLPSSTSSNIKKVEFFPEDSGVIDFNREPQCCFDGELCFIDLKTDPSFQKNQINGVLVLHADNDTSMPIQINSKLNTSEIALLSEKIHIRAPHSDAVEDGLLWALFFAFLGGSCLNLMPCVLPVLSFKVMNFVKMSQENRWVSLKHGLLFSLGILLSFWVLAGTILGLQYYGESVGWGFQLQEPLFVAGLAALLFLFALSQFGVFEMGLRVASLAGESRPNSKSENRNSFFSGVLATVVATPCTGPFLGSVIGLAVTLPFLSGILIFTFVALGLSAPYLLLSGFPSLLRFIPKPGPWMESFKQFMGFLLLATVLWLLWVFHAQTNFLSFFSLLISLFFISMAAWVYGQWATPFSTKRSRGLAYLFILLCLGVGVALLIIPRYTWQESSLLAEADVQWESFSPQRLAELQEKGTPVFIDFTAKWCLICQANHFTLSTEHVAERFNREGIVRMKADWTKNDPIITKELSKFGRNSVPLYLFYGNNGTEPQILPQVLTPEVLFTAFEEGVSAH
jgi:thiol:disulfide interchange protein